MTGDTTATAKPPQDCVVMSDVRAEIDRIDRQLVDLIAERFGYVDRAWQIKRHGPEGAVVPWRIQQVIDKVRARADERGVSPALVEALWRQMIGWFIQYEEERLRRHIEGGEGGGGTGGGGTFGGGTFDGGTGGDRA